ncbi:MAG: fibronectin type III domain-containing protein [Candidatus Kapabacteria bacterium]|nr:fibronectin type III domain-containing protein [Candidatus Kapabacteria bacterium]
MKALVRFVVGIWCVVIVASVDRWSTPAVADIPEPPEPPVLVSPADGATNVPLDPTLRWNPSRRARTYRLEVALDSGFTTMVTVQEELATTEYQLRNLNENTRYYWRVNASNEGGTSPYSSTFSFTTLRRIQPPAPPILQSPPRGARGVERNVTLRWNPVENAEFYTLQVATDSAFATKVLDTTYLRNTTLQLQGLAYQTRYYWRVRGANAAGDGEWSATWWFETEEEVTVSVGEERHSAVTVTSSHRDGSTYFAFTLPEAAMVTLRIFDAMGREVAVLIAEQLSAGMHQCQWSHSTVAGGVYYYRFDATPLVHAAHPTTVEAKPFVVLK